MPRRRNPDADAVRAGVEVFARLPTGLKVAALLVGLAVVVGLLVASWASHHADDPPAPTSTEPPADSPPGGPATLLFCFWNVENLFDDRADRRPVADKPYDEAFAADDPALRDEKLDHLADALLRMNGGRGPDVLACVEVESVRAAEMLRDRLNARLPDPADRYTQLAMEEVSGGRHIAPCVLARGPVALGKPRLRVRNLRILEVPAAANGHPLHLIVAHWTSQLPQDDGGNGEEGRRRYAKLISEYYAAEARADAKADVLVCGDFNCTPESDEVTQGLRATGDRDRVARDGPPLLLDLLAGKPAAQYGTIYYRGPLVYDHVCVSPGLLDPAGWGCDPGTVAVVTDKLIRAGERDREPWRFGGPTTPPTGGRGFSDHFPVTVRLTAAGPEG